MRPFVTAAVGGLLVAAAPAEASRIETVGRSVEGRAIKAVVIGPRDAARTVLVVGSVHGNETAGHAIVRALRARGAAPAGTALWLIRSSNPDGVARGTRQNARGVDLNRQAPHRWEALPRGTFYSGPRPLSEPESRAAIRLVRRIRPAVTIWYHQALAIVGGRGPVQRRYARAVGLPCGTIAGRYPGSITSWQEHRFPAADAFVVELAAGALSPRAVRRHVHAVVDAARVPVRTAKA
jgi:protein MpaA